MPYKTFKFIAISAMCMASQIHAATADDLMNEAIRIGRSKGELTGSIADEIKKTTHSNEPIQVSFERSAIEKDKCHIYTFTLMQPKIPNRAGQIVGDYLTVTKTRVCPDNREQEQPQVIECRVGNTSCMPPTGIPGVLTR